MTSDVELELTVADEEVEAGSDGDVDGVALGSTTGGVE